MPTTPRKARLLLKEGKAKVKVREPFTIQLLYPTGENKQLIVLGVDAGSKIVGLSASTEKEELFSAEVELRNNIVDLLSTRRQNRRARRSRKTRYRQARFNNRKKPEGWVAPSIQNKIDTHLTIVAKVNRILPISKTIVEVAAFDIQKIKNPNISGTGYQQGEQLDFWNIREYVLFRDGHKCQGRKGCKNKILNVHHIESRKTGGNAPDNLITLCEKCHDDYHKDTLKLSLKRGNSFRDVAFMGIMRWAFYNRLKQLYQNVNLTYGYLTKNTRISNGLPKEHRIDAYCIAGNIRAVLADIYYYYKKVRNQNRRLHKNTILAGGYRKANKAAKYVFGFQLFDKVKTNGEEGFIFARRTSGSFNIRKLDGTKISAGISYKKLVLLQRAKTMLIERRSAISSPCLKAGVSMAGFQ